jgi:Major Facilitator Superfamily
MPGLRFASPAYQRQKDIVHDLCDRLFRYRLQGHQHLVAQQVQRHGRDPRCKALLVDLAWLIDRLGGKRIWMAALALFLVGSIGASLAWNAPSLVAGRVMQGIGGGLMLPVLTTLLVQAADGRSLGR